MPEPTPGGYVPRYESPHGKPEGLADRLEAAADALGRNKILPWLGLGLHTDLLAAAVALRAAGNPPAVEYDL